MADTITRQCDDCGEDYDFLPYSDDSKVCYECRILEEDHIRSSVEDRGDDSADFIKDHHDPDDEGYASTKDYEESEGDRIPADYEERLHDE